MVHGLKGGQSAGPVSGAVQGQGRHLGRLGQTFLEVLEGRVAVVRVEGVAVVVEGCLDHPGLTKGVFDAVHDLVGNVVFG